jgi:hypothetical protein
MADSRLEVCALKLRQAHDRIEKLQRTLRVIQIWARTGDASEDIRFFENIADKAKEVMEDGN